MLIKKLLQNIFLQTSSSRRMFVGNDHISSYTKLINDQKGEVNLISTKALTKDLINKHSILNGVKYFLVGRSQIYIGYF